jgi:hypothetical protein
MALPPVRLLARFAADRLRQAAFSVRHPQRARPGGPLFPDQANIEQALAAGVHFLQRQQRADGAWVDFLLPVGLSDGWVTAHVAWVTEQLPHLAAQRERARSYLLKVGRRRGGWGFNNAVGHDCDSTAQALMVLHASGSINPAWVQRLVATQHDCGGFPTFPGQGGASDGWRAPHPDVTAVVVTALARLGVAVAARRRALRWLNTLAMSNRLISYWWPGEAYMHWVCANLRAAAPGEAPAVRAAQFRSISVPDTPMLIASSLKMRMPPTAIGAAIAGLLALQLRDGSWPCEPCLRLTDPHVMAPSADAPGKRYAGQRRVFSTAHSVAALWLALQEFVEAG